MDTEWLKDYLAVTEYKKFSRAAQARYISQPALSRRVRALEEWVGASLIHRTTHSVELSPAGKIFQEFAEEVIGCLESGRTRAQEVADGHTDTISIAATNALSLNFFPSWFAEVEKRCPIEANINLSANHMAACEKMLRQGNVDFLICHHHEEDNLALSSEEFPSWVLGSDRLMPVSIPAHDKANEPRFQLPGADACPIPFLSLRMESGMGRIVSAVHRASTAEPVFYTSFSSHSIKVLISMALEGRGVVWAPVSLVDTRLSQGDLVRAGDAEIWDIPIEIRIFASSKKRSLAAEHFGANLAALYGD